MTGGWQPGTDPSDVEPYRFRPAVFTPAVFTPAAPPQLRAPVEEPVETSFPPVAPEAEAEVETPVVVRTALRRPSLVARVGEELLAWFKTLVSAAVYATLIVTFGFQVARVEGESMAPTLENQDRLIVSKLAYRLGKPQIGDIVMLIYPLNTDQSFVKRVVALPGNIIKSVDGHVYVDGVQLRDDFIPEEYRSPGDNWGPETVPAGYYYVMGDHRNNSSDSRTWKYVPEKYIIGKVELRWWPVSHARVFTDGILPKIIDK
jgi:signal peptidase I